MDTEKTLGVILRERADEYNDLLVKEFNYDILIDTVYQIGMVEASKGEYSCTLNFSDKISQYNYDIQLGIMTELQKKLSKQNIRMTWAGGYLGDMDDFSKVRFSWNS